MTACPAPVEQLEPVQAFLTRFSLGHEVLRAAHEFGQVHLSQFSFDAVGTKSLPEDGVFRAAVGLSGSGLRGLWRQALHWGLPASGSRQSYTPVADTPTRVTPNSVIATSDKLACAKASLAADYVNNGQFNSGGFAQMAVAILVWLVALVLVASAKKSPKHVLLWGVLGGLAGGILGAIGILPLFGLAGVGIGVAVGAVAGAVRSFRHPVVKPPMREFEATHAHDNIAINAARNLLWVRDERGQELILEVAEVREWNHLWVPDRGYKAQNRLEIRTTRVDAPVVVAAFTRHPATIWGAPKNAREAEEWHARLGAFFHQKA